MILDDAKASARRTRKSDLIRELLKAPELGTS